MRYFLLLITLLFLLPSIKLIGETKIDSLEALLPTVEGDQKINVLEKIAYKYRLKQPEKTVEYGNQALQLAKSLNNLRGIQKALSVLGLGNKYLGNYDDALTFQQEALKIAEQLGEENLVAVEYNRIGIIYKRMGLYSIALKYYIKALDIREKSGSKSSIANLYNNIGNIYRRKGDLDLALEYYFKTLKIRKEEGEREGYAYILNNIGNLYSDLGIYDKALDYHTQSLKEKEKLGNKYGISSSYKNIGEIYLAINKPDKALECFEISLKLSRERSDMEGIANGLSDIGRSYLKKGDFEKAAKYLQESVKITEDLGDKTGIINSYIYFSNLYIQLNDYKEALNCLDKGLSLANEENLLEEISKFYYNYSTIYSKINQPAKAFEYFKKYSSLRDSIFSTEISKKITEFQIEQKSEELETEKKLLEEQNRYQQLSIKKKNQFILSFAVITFLGLILILLVYSRYRSKNKAHVELAEKNKNINEQNIFLQVLMDTIPNPMYYTDNEGKFLGCNTAFKNIHKKTKKEIIGKTVYDLYPKKLADKHFYKDKELLQKTGMQNFESKLKFSDGSVHEVIFYKNTYNDSKGKVAGLLGIMLDITSRKKAENKIKKSEKELREANASKDKFFSIIAHDLTNPFNAIIGFTSLLRQEYEHHTDDERKTMIDNIYKAADSTYKLLQNLLEWSKTQTHKLLIKPETIDLSVIAYDNISIFRSVAHNKNILLRSDIPFNSLIKADINMVNTVFRNLISNAIKFTDEGGEVVITSKNVDGFVEVCVADTGIGIKTENLNKLFSINEQVVTKGTANEKGTGLGLILCKEFIEKNGGRIRTESILGEGTKFIFTFPVSEGVERESEKEIA